MATLINIERYTLVVGDDVDSSYRTEQAAERAARGHRALGRRAHIIPPGEVFEGSGWADVRGVERAD